MNEIPDATTTDAALIVCPADGCDWTFAVPWADVKPETGSTDQRLEYRAHYAAVHGTTTLGVLTPGSVLILPSRFTAEYAGDESTYNDFLDAVIGELRRAARHFEFSVLIADEDARLLDVEQMRAAGWVRAADFTP